jgi:predicted enzyme related to lactoylglutathione lyase
MDWVTGCRSAHIRSRGVRAVHAWRGFSLCRSDGHFVQLRLGGQTAEAGTKPTHFDLSVRSIAAARRFFEAVFNWRFERFPMSYEYYRIQAGEPNEPGIDGGIGAIADAPVAGDQPLTQVTIPVPDIDEFLERVTANGGSAIEPKLAIPGIGWYATCAEPGGLKFGLIQPDPNAR